MTHSQFLDKTMDGFKEARIVIGEVLPRLEEELEEKEEPLTEVQLYHVRRALHAASLMAWYDAQVGGKEIEEGIVSLIVKALVRQSKERED